MKLSEKTQSIIEEAEGLWPDRVIPWGEGTKMANRHGVAKQWINSILKRRGFVGQAGKRAYYGHCNTCGQPMRDRVPRTKDTIAKCSDCRSIMISATCSVCGHTWLGQRSDLATRRRRIKTTGMLFCSRKCWGTYVGRTWGRGRRLQGGENAKANDVRSPGGPVSTGG